MDDRNLINCLQIVKRKILIIILGSFIVAIGFMGLKYATRNSYITMPTGDIMIAKTLKLEDYKDRKDILKYDDYLRSPAFLSGYIEDTKEQYEYDKLVPGWSTKTNWAKLDWLSKHLVVSYYGAGRMEIRLHIKQSEPMNLEYVEENGARYLDSFIAFINSKDPLGEYEVINDVLLVPEGKVVSENKVVLKYGIIGFFLGGVGIITILLVWNMYRENYGKN